MYWRLPSWDELIELAKLFQSKVVEGHCGRETIAVKLPGSDIVAARYWDMGGGSDRESCEPSESVWRATENEAAMWRELHVLAEELAGAASVPVETALSMLIHDVLFSGWNDSLALRANQLAESEALDLQLAADEILRHDIRLMKQRSKD